MNQDNFMRAFESIATQYVWSYGKAKLLAETRIRGRRESVVLNPVTAVALARLGLVFSNTKRDTSRAARLLGMTQQLAMAIYSTSNRGHSQIVRGKLLKIVGV